VLGRNLKLYGRQIPLGDGRIDLIYQNQHNVFVIVEIKLGQIGHGAVAQIRQYVKDYAKLTDKKVRGILVCSGVLPAYRAEIAKLKDITVFTYGWRMQVTEWTG
jgi:RecB family endonuclease NucS